MRAARRSPSRVPASSVILLEAGGQETAPAGLKASDDRHLPQTCRPERSALGLGLLHRSRIRPRSGLRIPRRAAVLLGGSGSINGMVSSAVTSRNFDTGPMPGVKGMVLFRDRVPSFRRMEDGSTGPTSCAAAAAL